MAHYNGLKGQILTGEPALEDVDNSILCAVIIAKLLNTTQKNVVNSTNEENARFISNKPSNRAQVYNSFASITFNTINIKKFITQVRSTIIRMEDFGINMPDNFLTYDLLQQLPKSLENIKQKITHSKEGKDFNPEALINHLEVHLKAVLSSHKKNKKWSKLEPRGGLGTLVGFNQEIKSYRILTEEGIIINSKSVDFLEFLPAEKLLTEDNELVVKEKVRTPEKAGVSEKEGEDTVVKEEEDEEELPELEEENSNLDEDLNSDNDVMIADSLIPKTDEPVGCILRDRTLQVQPLKYSHLLEDPMSFKKAVTCSKAEGWTKAIDEELENIEQHQVWLDQMEK
ncbi:hypothetical protein PGT21_009077 [Puccinia graminis f. sp. tritici]|uniref:Retrovirus-related Pol polyprotein from transposon TNT 1-94 n=1 Tax=Puccinia graminis f. sp. tritici TaxID=56615 RepID=A0A5B0P1U7_PUCGR|nr:hypothetical protein PGT21_009077 [Puccinia graminis f. sp. tritici]